MRETIMTSIEPKKKNKPAAALAAAVVAAAALMFFGGCDSGGGGVSGHSTITGNVRSFSTATAFYMPAPRQSGITRFLNGIADLLVAPAQAAVPGVRVSVKGTDLSSTTADDGSFVVSGVPAGSQTLEFSSGGGTASLTVEVPDNSTVQLTDIDCQGSSQGSPGSGMASVRSQHVEMHASDNNNMATHDANDDHGGSTNEVHHSSSMGDSSHGTGTEQGGGSGSSSGSGGSSSVSGSSSSETEMHRGGSSSTMEAHGGNSSSTSSGK
jgi:hypothetical protein